MVISNHGKMKGTKSVLKITANIFISFIGAGVLGLPFAFKESGILEGVIIMVLVAIFSIKAMLLIIDCKRMILKKRYSLVPLRDTNSNGALLLDDSEEEIFENPKISIIKDLSYGDVGYHTFGKGGKWLVDIIILISQLGFCCAYLVFISENLSSIWNVLSKNHWLILLLVPLFPLTLLKHLHSLAIFSFLAQISNVFAFVVVFWFDFEHYHEVKNFHPREFSAAGLPFFFAVAIYCFEGAGMILSLESSITEEKRHNFTKYFVTTLVCVTTLYITFGVCGYMSFGLETNAVITLNLPKEKGINFPDLVTLCLCLSLFFCYPVMMFPVTSLIQEKVLIECRYKTIQMVVLRIILVSLTGVVVVGVPNFANLMAFIGATCCTMLSFIFPGLFHYILKKGSASKKEIAFDIWLILLGSIGCIAGTIDALKRMSVQSSTVPSSIVPSSSEIIEQMDLNSTDINGNFSVSLYNLTSSLTN